MIFTCREFARNISKIIYFFFKNFSAFLYFKEGIVGDKNVTMLSFATSLTLVVVIFILDFFLHENLNPAEQR